jgi:hypothetical protein
MAAVDEDLPEPLARPLLLGEHLLEHVGRQQAGVDEELAEGRPGVAVAGFGPCCSGHFYLR